MSRVQCRSAVAPDACARLKHDRNGLEFGVMKVEVHALQEGQTCDDGLREPSCCGAVETKGLAAARGGCEEET